MIPSDKAVEQGGFPLMPLFPLLLLRVQGWVHHGEDHRSFVREKQLVDVADILDLLKVVLGGHHEYEKVEEATEWLPESFIKCAMERVEEFSRCYPETRVQWKELGF